MSVLCARIESSQKVLLLCAPAESFSRHFVSDFFLNASRVFFLVLGEHATLDFECEVFLAREPSLFAALCEETRAVGVLATSYVILGIMLLRDRLY